MYLSSSASFQIQEWLTKSHRFIQIYFWKCSKFHITFTGPKSSCLFFSPFFFFKFLPSGKTNPAETLDAKAKGEGGH